MFSGTFLFVLKLILIFGSLPVDSERPPVLFYTDHREDYPLNMTYRHIHISVKPLFTKDKPTFKGPLVIVIYKNDEWKDFVGLEKPSDLEETIEMSLSYDAKIPNNYLRITGWIGPTHLSVVKDIRFDDIVSELIMNVSLVLYVIQNMIQSIHKCLHYIYLLT